MRLAPNAKPAFIKNKTVPDSSDQKQSNKSLLKIPDADMLYTIPCELLPFYMLMNKGERLQHLKDLCRISERLY